ncbi:hypothetical protein GCM10010493_73950 [Streptomyces lavendulae subsp. grasserius]
MGALWIRVALAASGGMSTGSWIIAPIATRASSTVVAALTLWTAAAALGRAGARGGAGRGSGVVTDGVAVAVPGFMAGRVPGQEGRAAGNSAGSRAAAR